MDRSMDREESSGTSGNAGEVAEVAEVAELEEVAEAGDVREAGGSGATAANLDEAGGSGTAGGSAASIDAVTAIAETRTGARPRITDLSDEDLREAGGTRGGLARVIARRLEVSRGEAKRQLRDAGRVIRTVETGVRSRGKRMRRTVERTGLEFREVVERGMDSVQDLVRVFTGGLAGEPTIQIPDPPPEPVEAIGTAHTGTTGIGAAAASAGAPSAAASAGATGATGATGSAAGRAGAS